MVSLSNVRSLVDRVLLVNAVSCSLFSFVVAVMSQLQFMLSLLLQWYSLSS